jgi:Fe-S oxidoreductase
MRSLKRAADPHNILNPRKMFDAPPMDTHLRYGENYRVNVWNSSLHFNHQRGLAGAIEQCNGQGVCRKLALRGNEGTSGVVMCPSFQATRDEQNSTRGRANLLRALISSNTRYSELEPAVYSSLDLCLACKGCTSECPSGVDMPKLKYEFMNEYYKTHRRQLRDYLFGYFHVVSKWLMPVAPLANAFMQMNWSRRLIARIMGITEKRPFPVYATRRSRLKRGLQTGKKVIFLSDVFSRYLEPEVEQAAFDILQAAGYNVKILPIVGAGASLLSKGFIDAVKKHAEKVLDAINALDGGAGLSIVGCEPPEVYCLKHEYVALLPERRTEIESITKRVWLMEEFLLRDNNLEGLLRSVGPRYGREEHSPYSTTSIPCNDAIAFHPHCHQRAEGLSEDGLPTGTAASIELLRAFGFKVDVIDSGCCGMAGTFGYDAEHYELSMQVGELKLFPKIRELGVGNRELVSSGSACRLQIKQGVGKDVEHPLVVIADLMRQ